MSRSLDISGSGGSLLPGLRMPCSSKFLRRSTTSCVTLVLFKGFRTAVRFASSASSSIDEMAILLPDISSLESQSLSDERPNAATHRPTRTSLTTHGRYDIRATLKFVSINDKPQYGTIRRPRNLPHPSLASFGHHRYRSPGHHSPKLLTAGDKLGDRLSLVSRRSFLNKAGMATVALSPAIGLGDGGTGLPTADGAEAGSGAAEPTRYATARCVAEWAYDSGKAYSDPFNDLEFSVIFVDPQGGEHQAPAFWAGDQVWRIRYSPAVPGRYTYRTVCSDASNADLHNRRGSLEVSPYTGDNPLRKHGSIRVASDHLHFEHEDGTPFFWLGDTWWMGLCHRLRWPEDFQSLATDRVNKGFTVVQIVAGLYPDMPAFDPRGANEAGYPWEKDYSRINPHYFDMADARIQDLAERGIAPCIVACWGYFLKFMGA